MVLLTGGLVFAAVVQAIITGITLRGLVHARTAADAAKEAADAAKTNADAAQKSAAISELALIHANRAYIDIISTYNDWIKYIDPITNITIKQLRVIIKVQNKGATPVTKMLMQMGRRIDAPDANPVDPITLSDNLGTAYIAPGNENNMSDVFFAGDDVMKVFRKEHRIWLAVKINYRDVFEGTPNRVFQHSIEMTFIGNPETCWALNPGDTAPDIVRWAQVPELALIT